jgi:hypothetical protein
MPDNSPVHYWKKNQEIVHQFKNSDFEGYYMAWTHEDRETSSVTGQFTDMLSKPHPIRQSFQTYINKLLLFAISFITG